MEFKALDGREVIYTDELEKLVRVTYKDRLHVMDRKSYRVVCPRCFERHRLAGDHNYFKRNLSIDSKFSVGHCYRCDAVFVNKLSTAVSEAQTDLNIVNNSYKVESVNCSVLYTASLASNSDEAMKYLNARNPLLNPNDFKLGWKPNKIFIPFYIDSKLVFYQVRYINPINKDMKYFTPPTDYKPLYIPLVDGQYMWDIDKKTILVEGALTAIALRCVMHDEINIAAVLGNTLTEYQSFLLDYLGYSEVYVMMDKSELSERLIRNSGRDFELIPTDGLDAEELLNKYGLIGYHDIISSHIKSNQFKLDFSTKEYKDIDHLDKPIKTEFKIGY